MSDPVTDDTLAGDISMATGHIVGQGQLPSPRCYSVTTDDGMEPVITGCC